MIVLPKPLSNLNPREFTPLLRVLIQMLIYSVSVGFIMHVLNSEVPFFNLMLGSVCIGINEIVPVHVFAMRTRSIWKRMSFVAIGTVTGSCMVYALNEGVFGRTFNQRDWVLCLAAGLVFGTVYLGLVTFQHKQARMSRLLQNVAARKKLAEEALELNRYRLLAAQIKPHFLFNTLGNVLALMRKDTVRAETLLASLVEYLDSVLALSMQSTVDLQVEVDAAKSYLEIQSTRFPHLMFDVAVPEEMSRVQIPPLVLLTLVENAVHHGIGARPGAGRINILGEVAGNQCLLHVIDDGAGLQKNAATTSDSNSSWVRTERFRGHGMGLENVRKRLGFSFGQRDAHVMLHPRDKHEHGCIATVTMPFALTEARANPA